MGYGTVWYAGRNQGAWPWTLSAAHWVLRRPAAQTVFLRLPVISTVHGLLQLTHEPISA